MALYALQTLQPQQRPSECAAVDAAVLGRPWNVKLETKTMSAEIRHFSILYPRDLTLSVSQRALRIRARGLAVARQQTDDQPASRPWTKSMRRRDSQPALSLHGHPPICIIAENHFLGEKKN
jgi:hypothetical protein